MEENNYLYMLSLTRFRVFMICLVFFGLFSLFFFIGLAVGIKSGEGKGPAVKEISKGHNPDDSAMVSLTGTGLSNLDASEYPGAVGDTKPPFKVAQTRPPEVDPINPGKLLAQDRAMSGKSKVAKSPTSTKNPTTTSKTASKTESLFPEATPGELAQNEKYYLQLLVTSDKDKAEKNVDGLVKKNYKAYLRNRTDSAGKNLFLVRVGPYDDKSKALHDLASLREKGGYKDSFIASQKSAPKSSSQMMSRDGAETNPKKSVLTSL